MVDGTLIPIIALSIPIIIVPTSLFFKHLRRKQELAHLERIRAMELGRPLPGEVSRWTPARLGLLIAGGIPLATLSALVTATTETPGGSHESMWIVGGMIAIAAVISGSSLAARSFTPAPPAVDPHAKPVSGPEAFDFAGNRG